MKTPTRFIKLTVIATAIILIQACQPQRYAEEEEEVSKVNKAVCVLQPTAGDSASGVVMFTKADDGIKIEVRMNKLTPGKHGFHIHQWGDCTATDGTSAGGHFNPENKEHGATGDDVRHVGDLGNVEADSLGLVNITMTDNMLSFEGEHSIIGRSVVVHAGEDDLESQPTGNAGARVACGVIGIAGDK